MPGGEVPDKDKFGARASVAPILRPCKVQYIARPMAPYGRVHQNLMQVLLGAGAIAEEDLLVKLQECVDTHRQDATKAKLRMTDDDERNRATLDSVVSTINDKIEDSLAMKVAKAKNKLDKKVYYGIVNLRSDDFVKHATNLDKGEQELFYKVLEEIDNIDDKDKWIDPMEAQNKRLECQSKVSSDDASACLQQLEHDQWLHKSDDGNYTLGIRVVLQRMYQAARPSGEPSTVVDAD